MSDLTASRSALTPSPGETGSNSPRVSTRPSPRPFSVDDRSLSRGVTSVGESPGPTDAPLHVTDRVPDGCFKVHSTRDNRSINAAILIQRFYKNRVSAQGLKMKTPIIDAFFEKQDKIKNVVKIGEGKEGCVFLLETDNQKVVIKMFYKIDDHATNKIQRKVAAANLFHQLGVRVTETKLPDLKSFNYLEAQGVIKKIEEEYGYKIKVNNLVFLQFIREPSNKSFRKEDSIKLNLEECLDEVFLNKKCEQNFLNDLVKAYLASRLLRHGDWIKEIISNPITESISDFWGDNPENVLFNTSFQLFLNDVDVCFSSVVDTKDEMGFEKLALLRADRIRKGKLKPIVESNRSYKLPDKLAKRFNQLVDAFISADASSDDKEIINDVCKSVLNFYDERPIVKSEDDLTKFIKEALVSLAQSTPEDFKHLLDSLPDIPKFWKDDILENYQHLYKVVSQYKADHAKKIQKSWHKHHLKNKSSND